MADYSNSKFEVNILADQLFSVKPFEGVEINGEDVAELHSIYLKFSKGRPFAVLLDASNNFVPNERARELMASKEYTDRRIAAAFVTTTLSTKIFGNYFIQVNKPASPTKLFNDEESALEWLIEEVRKYNEASSV